MAESLSIAQSVAMLKKAIEEANTADGEHPFLFDTLCLADAKRILSAWADAGLVDGPRGYAHESSLHTLSGGGTRSEKAPAYHLVPGEGLRRTALRFALGAEKHGAENWKNSIKTESDAKLWAEECYNHMLEHALKMVSGDFPDDDHLGAIGWAQSVLCYIEATYSKLWTDLSDKEIEALPLERITVPENYLRSK